MSVRARGDGGERGIATSSTCTGRTPEGWREGEGERWRSVVGCSFKKSPNNIPI